MKSSNMNMMIIAIIGILTLGGSWYLLQQQKDKLDFSVYDWNTVNLDTFKGEIVVLDFMATWCGPCRASMPELVSLHEEIGDQFVMISIAVDPFHDTEKVLKDWMQTHGATWIHVRDIVAPPLIQQFGVNKIPTYFIIDGNGNIRYKHVGFISETTLKTEILSLVS